MVTRSSPDPLRILLVADDDAAGSTVTARLGADHAAGLRVCVRPEEGPAQVQSYRPDVVILALASLDAIERYAPSLLGAGERPFLIALCSAVATSAAARLCRLGVIDDYVQHFPVPVDPARLAASVHLAARIAAPAGAAASAGGPVVPPRRPLVLVVEDDEVLHTLVAAMLESERIDLVFEADGSAAIERIRAVKPDLVVMDVMLPGNDGVSLTEQIKSAPDLAAIPVVMLTGEARLDTLVRSMEAGAADFIVKPFTREALIAKLTKYLPAG
jgi:DNA-binding response OmpR family regulator